MLVHAVSSRAHSGPKACHITVQDLVEIRSHLSAAILRWWHTLLLAPLEMAKCRRAAVSPHCAAVRTMRSRRCPRPLSSFHASGRARCRAQRTASTDCIWIRIAGEATRG